MRRARIRWIAAVLASAGACGCTHNHYYYGAAPMATTSPAVLEYGAVCEVPSSSGNAVVVANPPRSQRVLVSRPQGALGSGYAWRRPDPEALATTRVEGGLDDVTTR